MAQWAVREPERREGARRAWVTWASFINWGKGKMDGVGRKREQGVRETEAQMKAQKVPVRGGFRSGNRSHVA